ncbi:hypothetical protein DSO57_1007565 [Entomophthora muscae]|uniref:Uncharacterized protein n=1 Tax=Entomophthora muscae TaxID=34485 RepID=A0ACC2RM88_9FUNG|nr:hypothetical protein DSO57_1007565 [Entomophthora muscae]
MLRKTIHWFKWEHAAREVPTDPEMPSFGLRENRELGDGSEYSEMKEHVGLFITPYS